MEKYMIEPIHPEEYCEVVDVWEASVRATHHFLKEEDIEYFKPLILNAYLNAVELKSIRNKQHRIIGFSGVTDHNLEMLFIHPVYRGKGIGKALLNYAINQQVVNKVDVNEENLQAVGFYQQLGFKTVGRSALDASGKPYPILHMCIDNSSTH